MKLFFLITSSLLLFCAVSHAPAQENPGFRLVNVPQREHGYHSFDSQVIDSQRKFDDFIKQVENQGAWNNRPAFLKALTDAKLDFTKESLVLLRHTEGSGSNAVSLAPPELKDDSLICEIQRAVPQIGTADMAYHCFAVAVEKGKAKVAEVWLSTKGAAKGNKPRRVFDLPTK